MASKGLPKLLSRSELSQRARIGAFALHASHNTLEVSAPGRNAAAAKLDARLLEEIDKRESGLPEDERQRRLGFARKAHYAKLALKSAQSRRSKKGGPA